jgi:TrmH family RNA methyltransferase
MKLDDVRKLHQKKFRDELGHFLLEGEHLALELQKAAQHIPALRASRLYVTHEHADWQSPFETQVVTSRQMSAISDTRKPQGIVAVVPMLPTPAPRAGERAIYLHEAQDPGNLGTILRTLAWFGGFRCLLGPGSVDPCNPKAVRASMGAIFHVPVETDVALESLPGRFARIACLDMEGERLPSPRFEAHDCYLFGNEARGLPREALAGLDARPFTVPGCGAIESLNLASVVNICVYELNRRRGGRDES